MINIATLKSPNFGDGVNKTFWQVLTQARVYKDKTTTHYLTTGSIMCHVNHNTIIFGTGFIDQKSNLGGGKIVSRRNTKCCDPKEVLAVRGPLTRDKLLEFGVECPANFGDPLILMPCIYDAHANTAGNAVVGIIPHFVDRNCENVNILHANLEARGFTVKIINIGIGSNYKKLIDEINQCEYIISSSLHGVIMGIVYKKKTIHTQFSSKVFGGSFKFQDFFQSIETRYTSNNIYTHELLSNVIQVNYENLLQLGLKLIKLIPFVDKTRKLQIAETYNNFYKL
jgi:pyruvyltransferase